MFIFYIDRAEMEKVLYLNETWQTAKKKLLCEENFQWNIVELITKVKPKNIFFLDETVLQNR